MTLYAHNDKVLSVPEVTTYTYDQAGNLDRETLPSGIVIDYDYDDLDRKSVV